MSLSSDHEKRLRQLDNLDFGRSKRWRGKIPIPKKAHPLVRQLYQILNHQKMTVEELANISGVSKRAISDWRYYRSPNLSTFIAAVNALGYRLVITNRVGKYGKRVCDIIEEDVVDKKHDTE